MLRNNCTHRNNKTERKIIPDQARLKQTMSHRTGVTFNLDNG